MRRYHRVRRGWDAFENRVVRWSLQLSHPLAILSLSPKQFQFPSPPLSLRSSGPLGRASRGTGQGCSPSGLALIWVHLKLAVLVKERQWCRAFQGPVHPGSPKPTPWLKKGRPLPASSPLQSGYHLLWLSGRPGAPPLSETSFLLHVELCKPLKAPLLSTRLQSLHTCWPLLSTLRNLSVGNQNCPHLWDPCTPAVPRLPPTKLSQDPPLVLCSGRAVTAPWRTAGLAA